MADHLGTQGQWDGGLSYDRAPQATGYVQLFETGEGSLRA
jgi:hypothetical protein